ncbi:MAG TPA: glycosyltransferase family 39 protein, partial [Caulobacteraceae bacterium]|nr:glycosyltransferase family 39 protein [Caulobacteraceae bacterium]
MIRSNAVDALVIAVVGYLAFFHRLGDLPIYVWDEARDTINALEMLRTGDLLVTYFHGRPDLWNTKPPGAIWLMAGSMLAFGINEFALRLPSALAGLATSVIVYLFTRRVADSRWAGLLAAVVLMATAGYVGPHVTRTADYDSLLVLFTTAAALSFGLALAEGPPRPRWLLTTGAATAAAILVKGVAGVLLVPGMLLFAIVTGKARALARSRAAWASAALVGAVTAAFYGLRELAGPGYLEAVRFNELGGRASGAIEGHGGPWWYYLYEATAP